MSRAGATASRERRHREAAAVILDDLYKLLGWPTPELDRLIVRCDGCGLPILNNDEAWSRPSPASHLFDHPAEGQLEGLAAALAEQAYRIVFTIRTPCPGCGLETGTYWDEPALAVA